MLVSELIELLQKMPQELEVLIDYGISDSPPDPRIVHGAKQQVFLFL